MEDNKLILLARLGELRDAGLLSEEDFAYERERVLSHEPPPEKPTAVEWLKQLWKEAPDWVPDPLVKFWPWPLNMAVLLLLVALIVIPSLSSSNDDAYVPPLSAMPNYVCWNLEEAKEDVARIDGWVTDIDAVKDRTQLWDRNWTVVRQSPSAGAAVTIDTDVTFWVAKHDEVAVKWPQRC